MNKKRLMLKRDDGFYLFEVVIVVSILLVLGMAIFAVWHETNVELPAAYEAWIKQTGNPKELTYEEWKALLSATKQSGDTTILFIPMITGR